MLNLKSYSNFNYSPRFKGTASAPAVAPKNTPEKNTAGYPVSLSKNVTNKEAIREGIFRFNHLQNTRPVLLSHTDMDHGVWLAQFDTPEERNLAIKILQNYAYIDTKNARKGFHKIHKELESEVDMSKTKFLTLGIAKSGSMMSYLYRLANKMRSKGTAENAYKDKTGLDTQDEKFLSTEQFQRETKNGNLKASGTENIVIVDDMIGDGDSLIEYFTDDLRDALKQYKNIYVATLVKDPDGEKRVKEKFPDMNIKFKCAQEIHKYDSPENTAFTPEEKEQITALLDKYGNKIAPELVNKYSRSKLFLSFDWNTPGNTPMIFNYKTSDWGALFQRYNGLQQDEEGTFLDAYC